MKFLILLFSTLFPPEMILIESTAMKIGSYNYIHVLTGGAAAPLKLVYYSSFQEVNCEQEHSIL